MPLVEKSGRGIGAYLLLANDGSRGNKHKVNIGFGLLCEFFNIGAGAFIKRTLRLFHIFKKASVASDDYVAEAAHARNEANFRHKRNNFITEGHAFRKGFFCFFKVKNSVSKAFFGCSGNGIYACKKKNCYNKQRRCSFHEKSLPSLSDKLAGYQHKQNGGFRNCKNVINGRRFFAYKPY